MKLRDYARQIGIEAGCMDSGCIWGSPSGMATNGGCRCYDTPAKARQQIRWLVCLAGQLANRVEAPSAGTRYCTCLGSCEGADRLGPGWTCALSARER